MEELLEILEEMKPGVDFKSEKHLIDDKVFDSLAMKNCRTNKNYT